MSPFAAFAHTLAVAIVAAVGELVVMAWNHWVMGDMLMADWQMVWLTPVSSIVMFLPLATVLALAVRVSPQLVSPTTLIFVTTAVGAFAVLFLFHPRLHLVAAALLSIGFAAHGSRRWHGRHPLFMRRTRAIAVAAALATTVAGVTLNGSRAIVERRARGAPPDSSSPNVLLLVLDTVRASSLSLHGYQRATSPAIDQFAARGVTFLDAISTSSWTLPAHASLFTGRHPHELSANWETPLDARDTTLAEEFARRGYATAGFVANVAYASRATGLSRGFAHYEDYGVSPEELLVDSSLARFVTLNPRVRSLIRFHDVIGRKTAADVNGALLRWLDRLNERPFFAFVNFYDAHEPYLPPRPFDAAFGPVGQRELSEIRQINARLAERHNKWEMFEDQRVEEQRAYDQSISYLDSRLGVLLEELEQRGRLANTIVIITADHGELFGEHRLFGHGNGLYLPTLHVPLIVVYPKKLSGGLRSSAPVSLRDLPATLTDLAFNEPALFPGKSLLERLHGTGAETDRPVVSSIEPTPTHDPRLPIAKGPMRSVIIGTRHYIRNGDGREELYDIENDRAEAIDLSSSESLERFRHALSEAGAAPRQ